MNLQRLEIAQGLPVKARQIWVNSGSLASQEGHEPKMGPFHQLDSGWGDQARAHYGGEFVKAVEGEHGEAGRTEQSQDDSWSPLMQEVINLGSTLWKYYILPCV